ncbi:MAG TPA: 2-C-methyl-D-erythritol 4-phosphate cytidylyltransferase, partial [Pseudoxanthomonas sp.]|nr:2-C-methyl-D-erythritol 4-phosphate cytidylyltransferase [Pseudoxanthomonas sp.]
MPGLWAIVPAAGRGVRFGGGIPKQYVEVAGQPIIAHALASLLAHPSVEGVLVAVAQDD